MPTTNFNDKQVMPDEAALAAEIGETKQYLDRICRFIKDATGQLTLEWKHYGQKTGWTLKLLSKKRNLLKASARTAKKLAKVERILADSQHEVARNLEDLADNLVEQVAAVETEMDAAEKAGVAA